LCLENFNQDSISSYHIELDQYQTIHKVASFHFNKIKLDCEYDTDPQFCNLVPPFESMLTSVSLSDLDPILEPTLILVPIDFEHESPILDSHIPLLENECEFLIWTKLLNRI